MSGVMPTADQVEELPAQICASVPEHFLDGNGHMATVRYVEPAGKAMGVLWTDVGMGWEDERRQGRSGFIVEQHLRYLVELRRGHEFSRMRGFSTARTRCSTAW